MMDTDPFLWIGIGIADPYPFPDPDPDSPFVTQSRSSLSDPIPIRIGSPIQDRRSMIAILPITSHTIRVIPNLGSSRMKTDIYIYIYI